MSSPANQNRPSTRRRVAACALAFLGLSAFAGCNQISFLSPSPNVRGITIPLPPPSIVASPEIRIDLEGDLDDLIEPDGTRVSVFEKTSGRGYYTFSAGGSWLVQDVLLDVTDNCLVLSSNDVEGGPSSTQQFKAFITSGEECVPGCSAPDTLGDCVCFEKWNSGC